MPVCLHPSNISTSQNANSPTVWDAKPETPGEPINWVELKTSRMITNTGIQTAFDQKLLKYWIQSFLLGVPRIIVGFRDQDGILRSMEEYETLNIPYEVRRRGLAKWDGNVCIRFAALFLQCMFFLPFSNVCRLSLTYHRAPPQHHRRRSLAHPPSFPGQPY